MFLDVQIHNISNVSRQLLVLVHRKCNELAYIMDGGSTCDIYDDYCFENEQYSVMTV